MDNKFVYIDEDDKCYGLTGMVISMNVFDSSEMLREITLDSDKSESISFTPDFFFNSNPRYSARIAWNEMLKQYQLFTGLVLGNILCRYNVKRKQRLTPSLLSEIKKLVEEEGRDVCQLDEDEIEVVFTKTYNYLSDIYDSYQIKTLSDRFVSVIKRRRTMSGNEVLEELQILRHG